MDNRIADPLVDAINGRAGYWIEPVLSSSECAGIKSIIFDHFLRRLERLAPEHVEAFAEAGFSRYHLESHRIDHASAWPQPERLLKPEGVEFLRNSSLFRRLERAFGGAEITNETQGKLPEATWRLVRPGQATDVGPLHADAWFWSANSWRVPKGKRCIKIWTMLNCAEGDTGLRVVPGSHLEEWEHGVEIRHGFPKPTFDEAKSGARAVALDIPCGSSVIFDFDLLHGGKPPSGDQCRVSVEFTVLVPETRLTA